MLMRPVKKTRKIQKATERKKKHLLVRGIIKQVNTFVVMDVTNT